MTAATALSTIPQVFAVSSNLWEELSDAAGLIIAVLFIMAGALIGFVLRWLIGKWQADSIEQSARLKAEAVQAEVESLRKEAEVSARAEVVKAREEFEASIASRRSDQEQVEARLLAREQSLDRRTTLLDAREAVLRAKAEEAEKSRSEAERKMTDADDLLQRLAKMTHVEARREVLRRANAALREDPKRAGGRRWRSSKGLRQAL